MKLIIQIPCLNEENSLPITVADLPRSIAGVDVIEYLIIDDGSTDRTVEVAREIGVHHVVSFRNNRGLASAFKAGIDACLRLGADIIVNTDADNQYCGEDIAKLVGPIVDKKVDIVIGERPIADIEHFSLLKKKLQRVGSWAVRVASRSDVPDAPSGFRAYSRDAAMRLNVVSAYTYTLETIIQAGLNNMAVLSVPIRTNPMLRESRLFKSMFSYIRRSIGTIGRIFMLYKPMKSFLSIGLFFIGIGLLIGIRYLIYQFMGQGEGHVQSLILAAIVFIIGTQSCFIGLLSDLIAGNRKILEDIQYRVKHLDYDTRSKLNDK